LKVLAVTLLAPAKERSLTLDDAMSLALENYEGVRMERESFPDVEAAVCGAKSAYDPLLDLGARWPAARARQGLSLPTQDCLFINSRLASFVAPRPATGGSKPLGVSSPPGMDFVTSALEEWS
jgi:hypothetical protein